MVNSSSYFLGFLFCLFVCSNCEATAQAPIYNGQKQGKTWCVAQVAAPDFKLQAFINTCCSQLNCKEIQPGGSCYEPNNLHNHASYALDLFYRNRGDCNADIGTPSISDPSFGTCHYP